mmetsp:Transcript_25429/g.76621  ORF Transcript_25429/g.76621 Transcript_25429/m.76621 type:complete len:397 (+) Transcript_25429:1482-2672(+)
MIHKVPLRKSVERNPRAPHFLFKADLITTHSPYPRLMRFLNQNLFALPLNTHVISRVLSEDSIIITRNDTILFCVAVGGSVWLSLPDSNPLDREFVHHLFEKVQHNCVVAQWEGLVLAAEGRGSLHLSLPLLHLVHNVGSFSNLLLFGGRLLLRSRFLRWLPFFFAPPFPFLCLCHNPKYVGGCRVVESTGRSAVVISALRCLWVVNNDKVDCTVDDRQFVVVQGRDNDVVTRKPICELVLTHHATKPEFCLGVLHCRVGGHWIRYVKGSDKVGGDETLSCVHLCPICNVFFRKDTAACIFFRDDVHHLARNKGKRPSVILARHSFGGVVVDKNHVGFGMVFMCRWLQIQRGNRSTLHVQVSNLRSNFGGGLDGLLHRHKGVIHHPRLIFPRLANC